MSRVRELKLTIDTALDPDVAILVTDSTITSVEVARVGLARHTN